MEYLKLIVAEMLIAFACGAAAVRADEINYPDEEPANSWLTLLLVTAVIGFTALLIRLMYERRKRK